jgi:hypothetical protein
VAIVAPMSDPERLVGVSTCVDHVLGHRAHLLVAARTSGHVRDDQKVRAAVVGVPKAAPGLSGPVGRAVRSLSTHG